MSKVALWCCGIVCTIALVIGACTGTDGEFIFNGSPVSFIKSFKEVRLTFPTSDPSRSITMRLKSRPGVIRPRLKAALKFIRENYSHTLVYRADYYDCKHFAYRLYEDAQAANFEARYVILTLEDQVEGHALAAIETSDYGTLFVDFTPAINPGKEQKSMRTVVQVREGKPYVRVPIEVVDDEIFRNDDTDFFAFQAKADIVAKDIASYHDKLTNLDGQRVNLNNRIGDFKNRVNRGIASSNYGAMTREEDELKGAVADMNSQLNALSFEEERLRNSPYYTDWIGKSWVVKSMKIVP